MKRDMDVIRQILLTIEAAPNHSLRSADIEIAGVDPALVHYNAALLIEAGLVDGETSKAIGEPNPHSLFSKLTWEGHEFLDATRDDTVWKRTKDRIANVGGTVSLGTVTQVASAITKNMLGI